MAGLGSFVRGIGAGYGLGSGIREDIKEKGLERERQSIAKEAQDKFGGLDDDAYRYMADNYAAVLADRGDLDGAREWLTFARDAKTRAGADLFAEGLHHLNMGNHDRFFESLGRLGKLNGYGDGYDVTRWEKMTSPDGQEGYRVFYKEGDSEGAFDVPADKLPDLYAATASPQGVWQFRREAQVAAAKRQADLKDFEAREGIKAGHSERADQRKDRAKAYDDASKTIREQDYGTGDDALTPRQVHDQAAEQVGLRGRFLRGGRGAPGLTGAGANVPGGGLVNRRTGEAITSRDAAARRAAPGPAAPQDMPAQQQPEQPAPAPNAGAGMGGWMGDPREPPAAPGYVPDPPLAGASAAAATPNFNAVRAAQDERAAQIRQQRMPMPRPRPEPPGLGGGAMPPAGQATGLQRRIDWHRRRAEQ